MKTRGIITPLSVALWISGTLPAVASPASEGAGVAPSVPSAVGSQASSPRPNANSGGKAPGILVRAGALRRLVQEALGFKIGTEWYLHYRYGYGKGANGKQPLGDYNAFHVSRGYLAVELSPAKWFDARITMDTSQDDTGDWKVRLKYLYGKFILPRETLVVSEPYLEFGIAHMPWLGFEESVNRYRMQGTMFSERQGLFNSADLGITAGVLLGRKLSKRYQEEVSKFAPGTWGSLQIGAYNGSGYHAIEKNRNKVLEWRATVRLLGFIHPNLQLSYFGLWGRGNVEVGNDLPEWRHHAAMLSYEHRYLVATAQYMEGRGLQKGEGQLWIDLAGNPVEYRGASGFLEVKLPFIRSSLFGRYDWFDGPNESGLEPYHRFIAGLAFHFWGQHKNVVLLDFDYSLLGKDSQGIDVKDLWAVTLTLQVKL